MVESWLPERKDLPMNSASHKNAVAKFKAGSIHALILTHDLEETLGSTYGSTVIAYNGVESLKEFVQLKGRARMGSAEFVQVVHESSKDGCLEEMGNYRSVIENMQSLMKINDVVKPESAYWKKQIMNPSSYIEVATTGAKVCKHNAKNFIEWYFKLLSNGNKYVDVELKFTPTESSPGKFREILELPKMFYIPPVTTAESFSSKKDCRNELAFELLQQLLGRNKFDEHFYPISKKKAIAKRKEKIMQLLEVNNQMKDYREDSQFIIFDKHEKYLDTKELFHEIPCTASNSLYLQVISISSDKPDMPTHESLGILNSVPLNISPFKIAVTDRFDAASITESAAQSISLVAIKAPTFVQLTAEQYQHLRFFYFLMLHMVNNAMTLFVEGILASHYWFGGLFLDFVKLSQKISKDDQRRIYEDLDIDPVKSETCHLLIVPLIESADGRQIHWEVISTASSRMHELVRSYLTAEMRGESKAGDVVLDWETRVPEVVLQESNSAVKVWKLGGVKEAAYVMFNAFAGDKAKVEVTSPNSSKLATGVNWQMYINYEYVPSILSIINEKRFYQDMTAQLLVSCVQHPFFKERQKLCADLLESAFTTPHAQRGHNYERLELLGDSILEHIVIHYVFSIFHK